ncbi:MAG: CDP-alcohol phosphatidyltransferase family protein [Oscillospiraceae bacterium]|nr:CDP-alcohol phosphatidyltransferase family protein [Oscillospiraceae bacterium]
MNIPNSLSIFRILLIPAFVYTFFAFPENVWICVIIWLVSSLSDIADGIIARKFNMTTQLGRILDPAADKLTQVSVIICLTVKNPRIFLLLSVFFVKEFLMMLGGILLYKKGIQIRSAKWFGKATTVIIFFVTSALVLLQDLPEVWVYVIESVAIVAVLFAFVMYLLEYINIVKEESKKA